MAAINVTSGGGKYYFALGDSGVGVFERDGTHVLTKTIAGVGSVVDVAVVTQPSGPVLGILDFNGAVVATANGQSLDVINTPVKVRQGSFSSVSVSKDFLALGTGTEPIMVFKLSPEGKLSGARSIGLGRGHPELTLDPERPLAFVSTHLPYFGFVGGYEYGVTELGLEEPGPIRVLGQVGVTSSQSRNCCSTELVAYSFANGAPNFGMRTATSASKVATSSLDMLIIYDTTEKGKPKPLAQALPSDLGFFPRDVAIDETGTMLVTMGPVSMDDPQGRYLVRAVELSTLQMSDPPFELPTDGAGVSAIATTGDTLAFASTKGPLFATKAQVLAGGAFSVQLPEPRASSFCRNICKLLCGSCTCCMGCCPCCCRGRPNFVCCAGLPAGVPAE